MAPNQSLAPAEVIPSIEQQDSWTLRYDLMVETLTLCRVSMTILCQSCGANSCSWETYYPGYPKSAAHHQDSVATIMSLHAFCLYSIAATWHANDKCVSVSGIKVEEVSEYPILRFTFFPPTPNARTTQFGGAHSPSGAQRQCVMHSTMAQAEITMMHYH